MTRVSEVSSGEKGSSAWANALRNDYLSLTDSTAQTIAAPLTLTSDAIFNGGSNAITVNDGTLVVKRDSGYYIWMSTTTDTDYRFRFIGNSLQYGDGTNRFGGHGMNKQTFDTKEFGCVEVNNDETYCPDGAMLSLSPGLGDGWSLRTLSNNLLLRNNTQANDVMEFGMTGSASWMQLPRHTADPNTSGWGASEKGRIWFNTTTNVVKYWDGSAIKTVTAT